MSDAIWPMGAANQIKFAFSSAPLAMCFILWIVRSEKSWWEMIWHKPCSFFMLQMFHNVCFSKGWSSPSNFAVSNTVDASTTVRVRNISHCVNILSSKRKHQSEKICVVHVQTSPLGWPRTSRLLPQSAGGLQTRLSRCLQIGIHLQEISVLLICCSGKHCLLQKYPPPKIYVNWSWFASCFVLV